jgi:HEAT repeat protein
MSGSDQQTPQVSDQEIVNLVAGLDNLQWNLQVQAEVLLLGERAVPALTSFLNGPPTQFPDGRVLAAEALGRIGGERAFHGLLQALDPQRFEGLSPVFRLSEETVQDAVARQLARFHDRRAIPRLLEALRDRHLLGAAEALVQLQEPEALPWLIEGLEDAFKRERLTQAILEFGPSAIPDLKRTLAIRRMREGQELLPSLERRAAALKLLGLLRAREAVGAIRDALNDPSDPVRMEAALALVAVESDDRVLDAVPALLAGLNHPDFLQRDRCADALVHIGPRCKPFIERSLVKGRVIVGHEAVPLSTNARPAALAVLARLNAQ